MRLTINGRNIDITPSIKEYVEEKIGRIIKHNTQIMDIEVTLTVTKNPSVSKNHAAEVNCFLNGNRIHLHEEAQSMYAAIDLLADKLDRQVKKVKEKVIKSKSGLGSIRTSSVEEAEAEESPEEEVLEVEIHQED